MIQWNRVLISFAAVAGLAGGFACVNVYSPIDNPHGDAQILSAARAAFDKGDIASARDYYGRLAGNETAISELVFVDLDSCGANIGAFATAFSKASDVASNPGILITVMAEQMNAKVSSTCFANLLAAYKRARSITDTNLRGFTSIMATLAITGEILGTNNLIAVTGTLDKADLYANPTTCVASCASCSKADGIVPGPSAGALSAQATISGNWGDFQRALIAAQTALTELGISAGPSFTLINSPLTSAATTVDNTYRCALAQISVGR